MKNTYVPSYRGFKIVRLPGGKYRAVGFPAIPDCFTPAELHNAIDAYIRRWYADPGDDALTVAHSPSR